MSGMFESWMHQLVAAVLRRETEANVVVVDWIPLAHQLYPDAVNNTQLVGQGIALLLDWLQVRGLSYPRATLTVVNTHGCPLCIFPGKCTVRVNVSEYR